MDMTRSITLSLHILLPRLCCHTLHLCLVEATLILKYTMTWHYIMRASVTQESGLSRLIVLKLLVRHLHCLHTISYNYMYNYRNLRVGVTNCSDQLRVAAESTMGYILRFALSARTGLWTSRVAFSARISTMISVATISATTSTTIPTAVTPL